MFIFMDRVRSNISQIIDQIGPSSRWRPHLKTTKLPLVWRELVKQGVLNFKCATVREARVFLESAPRGDLDILVSFPHYGPALDALGALARDHPNARVSVLCEDPENLARIAPERGVFVDLNPGMHRSGVPMKERSTILALCEGAGDRFRGLHYYDGHLHTADLRKREAEAFRGYAELVDLIEHLGARGVVPGEAITSGTPAFRCALAYQGFAGGHVRTTSGGSASPTVHRVSPGTVVFHDGRSEEQNPAQGLKPAALVWSRVVSHPREGVVTFDSGSKSLAAEVDPVARILGFPEMVPMGPSEEHFPFRVDDGAALDTVAFARGRGHWLVPTHVCPSVNLAENVVMVDRDGSDCSVVEVPARAHDVGWA